MRFSDCARVSFSEPELSSSTVNVETAGPFVEKTWRHSMLFSVAWWTEWPSTKGCAMKRQIPKVRDLAPLMKFKKPVLDPKKRRLQNALTIEDLRQIAKRRTPTPAFALLH